eukprot:5328914-Alexandrium_andersonii.AAC.1
MPGRALLDFARDLSALTAASIQGVIADQLLPAETVRLLADFASCKQYILACLGVLLAPWRKLPLLLCGAAHPDASTA